MELRRTLRIVNDQGMHARPCHAFVTTALAYGSALEVSLRGRCVNGKSILELMTLGAAFGDEIEVCARGADAQAVVDALVALVGRGFGES